VKGDHVTREIERTHPNVARLRHISLSAEAVPSRSGRRSRVPTHHPSRFCLRASSFRCNRSVPRCFVTATCRDRISAICHLPSAICHLPSAICHLPC